MPFHKIELVALLHSHKHDIEATTHIGLVRDIFVG